MPEKGGSIRIAIDAGEPGGPQGKQTFIEEDLFTADAPPGKFVTIEYQDLKLTAHSVHGSLKAKTVVAEGDVTLRAGRLEHAWRPARAGARREDRVCSRTGTWTSKAGST